MKIKKKVSFLKHQSIASEASLNKQTLNFHAKNNNFGTIFRMFKWDILGNFSPTVTKYIKVALDTSRDFLDFLKA